jgi:hypothetical protein
MEHPHYSSAGTESLEGMAMKLIAQWQQHFATMLSDPEAVQAMLTLVERMQRFYQFPYQSSPFATAGNAYDAASASGFSAAAEAPHAAPRQHHSPNAPNGLHDRPQHGVDAGDVAKLIGQLSTQLGRIESRLDALEQPLPERKHPAA